MAVGARDTGAELAELELLASYDAMRERAGFDYGCGHRARELRRRRRELEARGIDTREPDTVSLAELGEAWRRIAIPRYRRALLDAQRSSVASGRGTAGLLTPTARRTLETWRRLARAYGFELEAPC